MSTILKALRRLEEDKARGASSRPLREEGASGPPEAPRRRGLPWLPVAAMFIGAGIGASIWWVWPYERGGEPVRAGTEGVAATRPLVAAAPVVAAAPAPGAAPAAGDAAAPAPSPRPAGLDAGAAKIAVPLEEMQETGPPDDAFSSAVEVVQRPQPTPRIEPPSEVVPQQRVIADPPRVAAESPAMVAKRSRAPEATGASPGRVARSRPGAVQAESPPAPVASESAPASAPAPAPKPAPSAAPAKTEAPEPAHVAVSRAPEPAPAPAHASKASDADAAVRVKRTQWHPDAGRRSAELELAGKSESVHEGDVVGEYVVTEIRPSGVVLTRDGERIERSIGK